MYMGLMILSTQIYTHHDHYCLSQVPLEVELAIEKLRSPKTPGIDQIRADLIEAGVRKICHEIRKLIVSIWNK